MGKRNKNVREVRNLQKAKAVLESRTLPDAYLKLNPKSSIKSAHTNCYRLLTPEVMDKVRTIMHVDSLGETGKVMLEKVLQMVIARWLAGEESTKDMLSAVAILSRLVPDFKDRQVLEDLSRKKPEELDEEIKRLLNPVILQRKTTPPEGENAPSA